MVFVVTMVTKSFSEDTPSMTKLSALVEILKEEESGRVSMLDKNCVILIINISLSLFSRLSAQLTKVKLYFRSAKNKKIIF